MNDTRKLLLLINELIQLGGTVILIEHNTDFWVNAEWIIDIVRGGKFGGTLMNGPPSIIKKTKSPTGNISKDNVRLMLIVGLDFTSNPTNVKNTIIITNFR